MELCLQKNPNLLNDRRALLEASRKKLDESGYAYKKGRSWSKQISSDEGKALPDKRGKINKEFRLSRITELQDQIKDKSECVQDKSECVQDKSECVQYKELRRDAAKNVHNYKECDKLTEQLSVLKSERRQLQLELATLTRKQKKAEWYLAKKRTARKVISQPNSPPLHFPSSSPEPRSPSTSISTPQTPVSCCSNINSPPPTLSTPQSDGVLLCYLYVRVTGLCC